MAVVSLDRRRFLRVAAVGGATLFVPTLRGLVARMTRVDASDPGRAPGFGPLHPAGDVLALPAGFTCTVLSREGDLMSDGHATPISFDGMAAFPAPGGNVRLVRNHEVRDAPGVSPPIGGPDRAFDVRAGGGTTTLEIGFGPDGEPRRLEDRVTLSGTIVNCAGGPTPWGSWLSCEEATGGPRTGWERRHGYVFEVPADAVGPVEPVPLTAMGRFTHEAVAVDPYTGIVYLTEDFHASGFYRFVPDRPGDLGAGGRLQMLGVRHHPCFDARRGQRPGRELVAAWTSIEEPDPAAAELDPLAVFWQGWRRGGAVFSRLEGCWWGDGGVYFHATDGGDARCGQVWHYRPDGDHGGTLTLVFESPGRGILDGPDNITVSPRGGLVLCEDASDGVCHLRVLTDDGRIFDLARNLLHEGEFAGAVFDPAGDVLFVNIQGRTRSNEGSDESVTLAIRGPWEEGGL